MNDRAQLTPAVPSASHRARVEFNNLVFDGHRAAERAAAALTAVSEEHERLLKERDRLQVRLNEIAEIAADNVDLDAHAWNAVHQLATNNYGR